MAIDTKIIKETAGTIFTAKRMKKAALVLVVLAALGGIGSYGVHSFKDAHRAEAQALQQQILQKSVEQANERRAEGAVAPQNASLLTPEEIRSIAADIIGQDETTITFRSIDLGQPGDKDKKHDGDRKDKRDKHDKHNKDAKHEKGDRRDGDRAERPDGDPDRPMDAPQGQPPEGAAPNGNAPAPAPMAAPQGGVPDAAAPQVAPGAAPQGAPGAGLRPMHQVYHVKCTTGSGLSRIEYDLAIDAMSGAVLHSEVH